MSHVRLVRAPLAHVCAESTTGRPIESDVAEWFADLFGLLGDPLRLRILSLAAAHGEIDPGRDAAALSEQQQVLTWHLDRLAAAGCLQMRETGDRQLFQITDLGSALLDMLGLAA